MSELPNELLDKIIWHTLPEGFEGLAFTCKKFYALCTPFIENHNKLHSRFRSFTYFHEFKDPRGEISIKTAWDLIVRIASEPVIARYIEKVDLRRDSIPVGNRPREYLPDILEPWRGEAVVKMLCDSPHLKKAGISWESFYAEIEEKLEVKQYSQNAAAFLLTLLPNVKELVLPPRWESNSSTQKLLYAIIVEATQSHQAWDERSLARVTEFYASCHGAGQDRYHELHDLIPFVALPRMQSLSSFQCIATDDALSKNEFKDLYFNFRQNLEKVDLARCHIEDAALSNFLRHTPCLRTFKYSHQSKEDNNLKAWDIFKFVTAIEREVGNHLERLSVSIQKLQKPLPLGEISLSGFQRLQSLELPLEITTCDTRFSTLMDRKTQASSQPFRCDFVPATVTRLALLSGGNYDHRPVVNVLFDKLATKKELH